MSWGAVSTSAGDLHLDHRIAEAEIACKTAKDRGRGRVEVYQDTDQSMIRRHDEIGLIGSVREALRLERIVVLRAADHAADQPQPADHVRAARAHRRREGQHRRSGRLHVRGDALPDSSRDRSRRVRARLRAAQQEHVVGRSAARVDQSVGSDAVGSGFPRVAAGVDGQIRHRRHLPGVRNHRGGRGRQHAAGAAVHPPAQQPWREVRAR